MEILAPNRLGNESTHRTPPTFTPGSSARFNLNSVSDTSIQSPTKTGIYDRNDIRKFSTDENQCVENAVVKFKPEGTWIEKRLLVGESKLIKVSSSFIPVGLSVDCHSTTNRVLISSKGISKIRILLKGEEQSVKNGPSHVSTSEMLISEALTDKKGIQRITIDLPLPCKIVEILIVERTSDFVCIFDVHCYSSSVRPSSQSTPIPMYKRR